MKLYSNENSDEPVSPFLHLCINLAILRGKLDHYPLSIVHCVSWLGRHGRIRISALRRFRPSRTDVGQFLIRRHVDDLELLGMERRLRSKR